MNPLTPEEQAVLAELEAELETQVPPPPTKARPERFSDTPLGMSDAGQLFPLEPAPPTPEQ